MNEHVLHSNLYTTALVLSSDSLVFGVSVSDGLVFGVLVSVNSHIQFTIEMPVVNRNGSQTIVFLDTQLLRNISGDIDVKVFRKNTHTDKYLPFESHSHKNDKKAAIKTLLDRAKTIPSTSTLQTEETHNVLCALELNGYKRSFIKEVVNDTVKVNQKRKEDLRGSTCIPYVKGLSEKIKSILTKAGVRVALKPVCTLANIFRIPKTRPSEERTKAVVYKFECRTCSFHLYWRIQTVLVFEMAGT